MRRGRGPNFAIRTKIRASLRGEQAVENWKRSAANEDQIISYELQTLEDSFLAVEVSKDDVEDVIARWTGVPVAR